MKKIFMLLLLAMTFAMTSCDLAAYVPSQTAQETAVQASKETAKAAITSIPIPVLTYFQERRTIAKWAERWDVPNVITYVYLISYGRFIGYYISDGKPASTQSFLTPESNYIRGDLGEYDGDMAVEAPDIDGCYGANNPGIRFFTADGVAVEWGGDGASYLYSDAPLSVDVPLLHK